MKKALVLFLLIAVLGCTKKQLPPPGTTITPDDTVKKESVEPGKKMEQETVKEVIAQKEAKLQESAAAVKKAEEFFAFSDALFDYDKYSIRDDARPVLNSVAAYLKKNEAVNVIVEGHCDERGTNEYNLALGEKRAKSAKDYLSTMGVSQARMSVVTYGEEKPLCTDQNETCWQKNRRAHFVAQGK